MFSASISDTLVRLDTDSPNKGGGGGGGGGGDGGGGGGCGGGGGGCHELTQFVREKQMSAEKILAQIFPIAVCRIVA